MKLSCSKVEKIYIYFAFLKVPCYAFDSDGKKHDLNPLIKLSEGYLVDDPDDESDFYINICRSLSEFQKKVFSIFIHSSVGTQCGGVHFSRFWKPVSKHFDYIAALNQTVRKAPEQVLI